MQLQQSAIFNRVNMQIRQGLHHYTIVILVIEDISRLIQRGLINSYLQLPCVIK